MLARLYRAIGCEGVSRRLAEELAQRAGLPVYRDLASALHPARSLGDLLAIQAPSSTAWASHRLALAAAPGSELALSWQRTAALVNLSVLVVDPAEIDLGHFPSSEAEHGSTETSTGVPGAVLRAQAWAERLGVDLLCDPRLPACTDGRPALWQRIPGADRLHSLAANQAAGHRHIVQALLLRQWA